jgi:hypothetical protein
VVSSSCHLHPSAAAAAVSAAALPAAAPACQAPFSRYQMVLLRPWWGIWAVIFCMTSQETNPPLKSKQPKASQSLLSPQSCPPPSRYRWLIDTGVLLLVGSGSGWSYNQRDACEAHVKEIAYIQHTNQESLSSRILTSGSLLCVLLLPLCNA